MYLQTRIGRRLIWSGEILVVLLAGFVVLVPKVEAWGVIGPLLYILA